MSLGDLQRLLLLAAVGEQPFGGGDGLVPGGQNAGDSTLFPNGGQENRKVANIVSGDIWILSAAGCKILPCRHMTI